MGNHRWNMKANLLPELEKFCVGSSRNTQQILESCAVIDSLNPKENKNRCGSLELNSSQIIGSYGLVLNGWLYKETLATYSCNAAIQIRSLSGRMGAV